MYKKRYRRAKNASQYLGDVENGVDLETNDPAIPT